MIQQTIIESLLILKLRSLEILYSPLSNLEMLWLLIPLIANLIFLEFYFSRYQREELGWNTAYSNALVLIFIAVMLAKHLYETGTLYTDQLKFTIIAIVILTGITLTLIDFFHWLPERIAFKISAKVPINYIAFIAIILVYTNIPLNWLTFWAFVTILIALLIIIGVIHFITPKVRENLFPPSPEEPED